MAKLLFERIALGGAILALLLAILWPHSKPILLNLLRNIGHHLPGLSQFVIKDLNQQEHQARLSTSKHPRLSGQTLKRKAPDIVLNSRSSPTSSWSNSPHAGIANNLASQSTQTASQASPLLLALLYALVLAMIVYATMRRLSTKCSPLGATKSAAASISDAYRRTPRNAGKPLDRRKLQKMSREERTRQLILRHGGKNVSQAIKFLANELAKQKLQLLEENQRLLSEAGQLAANFELSCDCSCHEQTPMSSENCDDSQVRETEQGARKQ